MLDADRQRLVGDARALGVLAISLALAPMPSICRSGRACGPVASGRADRELDRREPALIVRMARSLRGLPLGVGDQRRDRAGGGARLGR